MNVCNQCGDTHVLRNTGKCILCAVGCKTCLPSDLSACVGCVSGYYPTTDQGVNRCLPCFKNCTECSSETVCSKCVPGYVLSVGGTKCSLKCSENCATCQDNLPNKCLSCFADGTLNAKTSICDNNLACNTDSSCTFCPKGYALSNEKKCLQCTYSDAANCMACMFNDLSTCARCSTGYYLLNKACKACSSPCITC